MELVHRELQYQVAQDTCIPKLMLCDWLKDEVKQLLIVPTVIFNVYSTFAHRVSTDDTRFRLFISRLLFLIVINRRKGRLQITRVSSEVS